MNPVLTVLRVSVLGLSFLLSTAAPASADHAPRAIEWRKGTELMLFGSGDLEATNRYLAPLGLEAMARPDGKAVVVLSPGKFRESSYYGPFDSTFAAILAKPKGEPASGSSFYFFGWVNSNRHAVGAMRAGWGMPVEEGDTRVRASGRGARSVTVVDRQVTLDLRMGEGSAPVSKPASYQFDVYSPSAGGASPVVKYAHVCTGQVLERPYAVGVDRVFAARGTSIGDALAEVGFQPELWNLYSTESGRFDLPKTR